MQQRLLVLLAIAVLPLSLLGGLLAWQNYLTLSELPQRRVELIHRAAAARYDSVLEVAHRLVSEIAADQTLQSASDNCDQPLARIFGLERLAFDALAVVGADRRVRCAVAIDGRVTRVASWLDGRPDAQTGSPDAGTSILIAADAANEAPALVIGTRLISSSVSAGSSTVLATLSAQWLAPPHNAASSGPSSSVWLLDAAAHRLPLGAVDPAEFPGPDALSRIMAEGRPLLMTDASGAVIAYQGSTIVNGLDLLVSTRADADVAAAQRRLGVRIAELGALLLAGLAGVTFGASLSVVEPLRRLSHSVARWRAGGAFDANPPPRAPAEIKELALSFSRATASLAEREKQLRIASTQQDLLMQEIHHRVKNNLQIIASLLNLQASRIRQPEAKAEFQSARDRIRALATLHRHLYAHNELHTINMRSFLNELCGQLLAAIGDRPADRTGDRSGDRSAEPAAERIALQIDASELQISSDQAVPIALIVTEAVSNAAKYAFPGGRTGHIWVTLTTETDAAGDERACLSIRDDGVGIPAGRAETETGVRDGIGIQLIRGFARQLAATLVVKEEAGTSYVIEIPLRRKREDVAAPVDLAADS